MRSHHTLSDCELGVLSILMAIASSQDLSARKRMHHVAGICLALLVFGVLLLLVTQIPNVSTLDYILSQSSQQLRGPVIDQAMLAVTLLGDTWMATLIVALVVIGLLSVRRWWLSLYLVCIGLSAMLSVSVIKTVIARARPELAGGLLHSFSFPSGHSCSAALMAGLLGVMLAYRQRASIRYPIYAIATLVALLIAYSRVHLLAHWPSDVIAGLALGYALVVAFAWQLHTASALTYRYRLPLIATSAALMLAYILINFSSQASRYALG